MSDIEVTIKVTPQNPQHLSLLAQLFDNMAVVQRNEIKSTIALPRKPKPVALPEEETETEIVVPQKKPRKPRTTKPKVSETAVTF